MYIYFLFLEICKSIYLFIDFIILNSYPIYYLNFATKTLKFFLKNYYGLILNHIIMNSNLTNQLELDLRLHHKLLSPH